MIIAPTLHSIFQEWKSTWEYRDMNDKGQNWTQHWMHVWALHINMYLQNGWHLIPLAPKSKRPLEAYHWDVAKPLDQVRAMDFVRAGCNIGVVAGPSRLVILDFDEDTEFVGEDILSLTPTVRTPRGYQFFTKAPISKGGLERLRRKFPKMDTPRTGIMYALVPPSQSDALNDSDPNKHDYRVRLFVSSAEKPMGFSRFARIIA
jgi:hypothetical protein